MCAISAKKLAQHAIKRLIWAILPALGEYFRAIANHSRRWANIFAPMLLTAPQDETVDTNAETSGRLHETHDSFVRQNCAENRCIWLALVSSVSPETEHTPAKAMTVSRELPAAVPAGGGKAWPDNKPTRRATHQRPGAAGVEGAGGRRRVAAGPGRASRSTTPSRRLACGDLAGGPPPTGTHSGPAHQGKPRGGRNTSGATSNTTTGTTPTRPGIQKTDIRIGCRPVVELGGFEPPTFSLRTRRATNCAIAPRTRTA